MWCNIFISQKGCLILLSTSKANEKKNTVQPEAANIYMRSLNSSGIEIVTDRAIQAISSL